MDKIKIINASLVRIFFARLIDLTIMSASFFLFAYFFKIDNLLKALLFSLITLIIYLFYFVFFPFLIKGSTIGKLIFSLHVINKDFKKPKFSYLLYRELYFIFIPYIFYIICQFIRVVINFYLGEPGNNYGYFAYKVGVIFYSFWILYISLTIILQKDHLSAPDSKLKTRVVYFEKEDNVLQEIVDNKDLQLEDKNKKIRNIDFPGNVNTNELDKIEASDYKEIINKKWKKQD